MAIKQNNNWTSNSTQLVNQRAYSQSAGCIIGSQVGFGRGPKVNPRVAIHIEVIAKSLLTLGPEISARVTRNVRPGTADKLNSLRYIRWDLILGRVGEKGPEFLHFFVVGELVHV
jgi:hypothetical protein